MLKLLGNVLAAPITGPVRGLEFILNAIRDEVESQALDESKVQGELMQLGLRQQMGEINDAEYRAKEKELLGRLNEIRSYKESLAQEEADLLAQTEVDADEADWSAGPSGDLESAT